MNADETVLKRAGGLFYYSHHLILHMADAPFSRQISAGVTNPKLRAINNEYHLELSAKNTADIKAGQAEQMKIQLQAAAANLRAMGVINNSLSNLETNMVGGFEAIIGEARYMSGQLEEIEEALSKGFEGLDDTLHAGFTAVVGEISRVVNALETLQKSLNEIADTLSHPYETEVRELLAEGRCWLKQGELTEGREQGDNRRDALRLFEEVIANKKGATNFVAWFNAGYLHWKISGDFSKAEEYFYHAQRLSAQMRNPWHTKSLRFQAEMQYLQAKHEDAWASAKKALTVQREYGTLYDAARYAAKTGRSNEVEMLLDECIEMRPTTIVTMFSEEDFLG